MSREIFQLADSDAEDYLSFAPPENARGSSMVYEDNQPRAVRSRKAPKSQKTKVQRITEDELFADLDSRSKPVRQQSVEDDMGDEPARKIPMKQAAEHQTLMMCLQRYAASERFAPMLKNAGLKLTNLESKTAAELKTLQVRVRTVCSSSGGSSGALYQGILMGAAGVERMAPKRIIDLDGYSASLRADPEFEAISEMLELDLGWASSMSPMQRMALCLGRNAMSVAAMNRQKSQLMAGLIAQQQMAQQQQQQQQQQQPTREPPAVSAPQSESDPPRFAENAPQIVRAGTVPVYD